MEAHWTQQQAINFECARDVIIDCLSILSVKINEETDSFQLQQLRDQRYAFSQDLKSFHVSDDEKIAVIRAKYDAFFSEQMTCLNRKKHGISPT